MTRVPSDPDLTPVWGDDEVGDLPEDYAIFHYPNVSIVDEEVFISYAVATYAVSENGDGKPGVRPRGSTRTRILSVEWFYR